MDRLNKFLSFLAQVTSDLTWEIPELQAESLVKRQFPFRDFETSEDITLAKLVLPQPGGPYNIL